VGGPAAVDGQDDAGEVAGGGVGEQQGGAGELGGLGPPADRDLCGQEVADLRVVVHARVQRGAEWAGGERVDGYPGAGQFDGQAAGELDNGALAGGVPGPGGAADQARGRWSWSGCGRTRRALLVARCRPEGQADQAGPPGP